MKKLYIFIIGTILFTLSCKNQSTLTKEDVKKFSVKGDSILYDGNYVAKYLNVEWEYYRGKKTLEISVERIGGGADQMTDKIVEYIIYKHPKSKAEVKIPR
jgi:hypothetical protein